jgi:biopolymer transport protein ExbD
MLRHGHLLAAFVVLCACGTSQPAVTQCPQCPVCPEVAAASATAATSPPGAITSVPLDVPRPAAGADQSSQVVSITRDGKLFLGGRSVPDLSALKVAIQEVAAQNPDVRVAIEADKDVTHGQVIAAIDAIKQAGVSKVAFATAPATPPAKP